jgi:L-ascorbate metabolism protein UlaG (beta-lactamase superfamily)
MKRRQLVQYIGTGLITTFATTLPSLAQKPKGKKPDSTPAKTPENPTPKPAENPTPIINNGLTIQWLGHTCFLFNAENKKVLTNPFETKGCTAKYKAPKIKSDLVLISSFLLDEGAVDDIPGNPKFLYDAGVYKYSGIPLQGISIPHDRVRGKRFGNNVVWKWQQAGMNILHLGGAASPLDLDQKILMGRPDILLIPVGGSDKAYTPQEAKQAIAVLNPKIIIPTHYLTEAADQTQCNLAPVDEFLQLMSGVKVNKINSDTMNITADKLPENEQIITVFSYQFS